MFQDSGRHDFCALEDELEVRPTIDQKAKRVAFVFACLGKKNVMSKLSSYIHVILMCINVIYIIFWLCVVISIHKPNCTPSSSISMMSLKSRL